MQKWEYLYLGVGNGQYNLNGVQYILQQGVTVFFLLNSLGAQGWEMVSTGFPGVESSYIQFEFKRSLPVS